MASMSQLKPLKAVAAFIGILCGAPIAGGADLADVVEKVEPAVVRINTGDGIGSGVVVDGKGLVITNYHVVDQAKEATATFRDGKSVAVEGYLAADSGRDLALLQLKADKEPYPTIVIAAALPRKGERVAALGAPLGFSFSASEGIVSAVRSGQEVNQVIEAGDSSEFSHEPKSTWIQTTAAISGGNSGGPLVDMQGQLLGLNTFCFTGGQNLNFAISAVDIKQLLEKPHGAVIALAKLPAKHGDDSEESKAKVWAALTQDEQRGILALGTKLAAKGLGGLSSDELRYACSMPGKLFLLKDVRAAVERIDETALGKALRVLELKGDEVLMFLLSYDLPEQRLALAIANVVAERDRFLTDPELVFARSNPFLSKKMQEYVLPVVQDEIRANAATAKERTRKKIEVAISEHEAKMRGLQKEMDVNEREIIVMTAKITRQQKANKKTPASEKALRESRSKLADLQRLQNDKKSRLALLQNQVEKMAKALQQ
ncbi:MAG: trypsin-like peptidase domain-containing protein [Planctomycetia bacterium]|nr:trypsin-like peptidase domain-containing protein [Planctomycetia bacterium]